MQPMGDVVRVNGTGLFVDDRGPRQGMPVLFIHGGPGNSCWDFMASAGERLAAAGARVIGVDQRGVLRSEPVGAAHPVTVSDLVEDFEALRAELGVERWVIIGHSAGGAYALDYALSYPGGVVGAVFDCPAWDCDATDRYRLPKAADLLEEAGQPEAAQRCRSHALKAGRITAADETWVSMQALGDDYMRLFLHDDASARAYTQVMSSAPEDLDWSKGLSHLPLLAEMYASRLDKLSDLTVPHTLFHGVDDMVAAPNVIEAYRIATHSGVHTFEHSGHFAYVEEPDAYASAVQEFLRTL